MRNSTAVIAACVALLALSSSAVDAKVKSAPKSATAKIVVPVGLEKGRSTVNPWSLGVDKWTPPVVRPGTFLLFRWMDAERDVQQFPDKDSFDTCNFYSADPLGPPRKVGVDVFLVRRAERGKTLYFGSRVGTDCYSGLKVAIPVS